MKSRQAKNKWIIGGGIIALVILGLSFLQLGDYTVYFYTPEEAFAQAPDLQARDIRVGGMVVPGSVNWQPEELKLNFTISDLKGTTIAVEHKGTPPDMFKENQGVVVEGRISSDGQSLLAKTLMVKHSEEYKIPDQKHSMDKQLLEKSLFK
ncbi:MAG: cytochrome c maturation protein CcmE [Deltaproteobacteria bacterium]|nr:cytochrome c maturation protein CcmE [Deltaproteobacteria bacterium]